MHSIHLYPGSDLLKKGEGIVLSAALCDVPTSASAPWVIKTEFGSFYVKKLSKVRACGYFFHKN